MPELWLPVVGYEGFYEVSNLGRVRSMPRTVAYGGSRVGTSATIPGGIMAQKKMQHGHMSVYLRRDGRRKYRTVHQLVLEAFGGPRPHPSWHACHNNGVADDNRLENLRWDTASANLLDRVKHGTHHWANKTHCPSGHPYDSENTYITPSTGDRICRACMKIRGREWWRRNRGKQGAA